MLYSGLAMWRSLVLVFVPCLAEMGCTDGDCRDRFCIFFPCLLDCAGFILDRTETIISLVYNKVLGKSKWNFDRVIDVSQ